MLAIPRPWRQERLSGWKGEKAMTEQALTGILAERVMGWKVAPDRFIKSGRSWIPRWRFRPFADLADAFQLLDRAAAHYTLTCDCSTFAAEVQIESCRGKAVGEHKARTITVAVARALRLEVDE
jgi:hypothetical protein